ncbi:hypothetical protein OOK36_47610 [Streptomyces sp. NBC_00365]|nr:hypothetical protein [Streptomyces sp. NBC_00365]MCX5096300.1 hypothetical protein [Streptomyces sp. NBC_00365]
MSAAEFETLPLSAVADAGTTTYGTLVSSGGSAGSGTANSPVLYLACV